MSEQYHGNVSMADGVYYKLMEYGKFITVVCLQWFDEYDYNQSKFVTNSSGDVHVFENETRAIEKLNEWYKPDEIDPEYRKSNTSHLNRD